MHTLAALQPTVCATHVFTNVNSATPPHHSTAQQNTPVKHVGEWQEAEVGVVLAQRLIEALQVLIAARDC